MRYAKNNVAACQYLYMTRKFWLRFCLGLVVLFGAFLQAEMPDCDQPQEMKMAAGIFEKTERRGEKTFEETLLEGVISLAAEIDVSGCGIKISEVSERYLRFCSEHIDLFYLKNSASYLSRNGIITKIMPVYTETDKTELSRMMNLMEARAQQMFACVTEDMGDVAKALVLHDCLLSSCICSREGVYWQTAYGALVEGTATCEGYVKAYIYLLKRLGIEARTCTSKAMGHVWVEVKLDGKFYYVDLTWDDPVNRLLENIEHNYFLLSLEGMKKRDNEKMTALLKAGKAGEPHYHHDWDDDLKDDERGDSRYDDIFWHGLTSGRVICIGNKAYGIEKKTGIVWEFDLGTGQKIRLVSDALVGKQWPVVGKPGAVWIGAFSRLAYWRGFLFFNSADKLYYCKPEDGEIFILPTEAEPGEERGFFQGFLQKDGGHPSIVQHFTPNDDDENDLTVTPIEWVPVKAVQLDCTSRKTADDFCLKARLEPSNATCQKVHWSSSDEAVATVDQDGRVTLHKKGETVISASSVDGGMAASCRLISQEKHVVSAVSCDEDMGNVSGAGECLTGENRTVVAAPKEGNLFVCWKKDGRVVSVDREYSFAVSKDVSLTAVFAPAKVMLHLEPGWNLVGMPAATENVPPPELAGVEIYACNGIRYQRVNWPLEAGHAYWIFWDGAPADVFIVCTDPGKMGTEVKMGWNYASLLMGGDAGAAGLSMTWNAALRRFVSQEGPPVPGVGYLIKAEADGVIWPLK